MAPDDDTQTDFGLTLAETGPLSAQDQAALRAQIEAEPALTLRDIDDTMPEGGSRLWPLYFRDLDGVTYKVKEITLAPRLRRIILEATTLE